MDDVRTLGAHDVGEDGEARSEKNDKVEEEDDEED